MDDRDSDPPVIVPACCFLCIAVIALVVFILGVVIPDIRNFRPDDIRMAVTHASLTDDYFNITNSSSNNNYYNLELNITIRNPNKYFGIDYYDKGLIVADYHNTSALANIADFHQPPKNMTFLTPSFKLQQDINFTDDAAWSGKGNHYDILIRLYFPKTFKTVTWWRRDSKSCSLMFTCDLKQVPLQNGSQSVTTAFNSTKCQSRYTYSYFC